MVIDKTLLENLDPLLKVEGFIIYDNAIQTIYEGNFPVLYPNKKSKQQLRRLTRGVRYKRN